MNGQSSTFGGVLGRAIIIIAFIVLVTRLPEMYEFVNGVLWWAFGK